MATVTLTERAQRIIDSQIASGAFEDPAEVVEAALALMGDEGDDEYWEMVAEKLDEGLADIAAGRVVPHSPELFESIKRRGRDRLAANGLGSE